MSHLVSPPDLAPAPDVHRSSGQEITVGQAAAALVWVVGYLAVAMAAVFGLHAAHLLDLRTLTHVSYALTLLTVAAVLAVYVHLVRRNGLTMSQLGFRPPGWQFLHLLWQAPVVVIAAMGTQGAVLALTGRTSGSKGSGGTGDMLAGLSSVSTPVVALVLVLVAVVTPLWEETLFRGAFFSGFAQRFGAPLGIVLSAVVCACFHVAPLVLPYVFVLGLGLGWVRWFHRNLWASVLLHALNNALSVVVVLTVS